MAIQQSSSGTNPGAPPMNDPTHVDPANAAELGGSNPYPAHDTMAEDEKFARQLQAEEDARGSGSGFPPPRPSHEQQQGGPHAKYPQEQGRDLYAPPHPAASSFDQSSTQDGGLYDAPQQQPGMSIPAGGFAPQQAGPYAPGHGHEGSFVVPPTKQYGSYQHDQGQANPSFPPPPQQGGPYVQAPGTQDSSSYPPPQRLPGTTFGADDDPGDGTHYTRNPHKLTAYLVSFPTPTLKSAPATQVPQRFLIYTPPAPPIATPKEGDKEGKVQKMTRKWQDEVREAKTNQAKVASWKGVKGRATKGIDWAMGQTQSSSLAFLNRIPGPTVDNKTDTAAKPGHDSHADDGITEGPTTKKTVGLEEMVLVYPASLPGTQEQIREEFVNSMLRTKSKAQKDAIIATGLIPVSLAVDILATLIWPFGGLFEIDTVWAVSSMRGAKTARSVTKRLNSSGPTGVGDDAAGASGPTSASTSTGTGGAAGMLGKVTSRLPSRARSPSPNSADGSSSHEQKLKLTFVPSARVNILTKYLASECHKRDAKLFSSPGVAPTETDVVTAIGWAPSQTGGETKNWEDEQWELSEVKDDVKQVMHKGAREWDTWCKAFEKDPVKAMKK